MTDSLLIAKKAEDVQPVAQPLLADLPAFVDACAGLDGEVLGEYVERNWDPVVGTSIGLIYLVREMKRKFGLLDRKKQVDGTYKKIRGFTSFKKWFASFSGKSERLAYYLLETEEKKHRRNAERRTTEKKKDTDSATFLSHCGNAKRRLAEIQRQINKGQANKPLYEQINPTINEVFVEFLALISPEGYEVLQGDKGWWISKKEKDPKAAEAQKAKRSAAAKKATATRAANKAAAQPAPAVATPATSLGECEEC